MTAAAQALTTDHRSARTCCLPDGETRTRRAAFGHLVRVSSPACRFVSVLVVIFTVLSVLAYAGHWG